MLVNLKNRLIISKMIQSRKTKKFSCKGVTNHKSKYLEDIELKSSATRAKTKMPRKSICKKNRKCIGRSKSRENRKKKDKNNSSANTNRGILELFELDKEYILLYHLSMLESKIR